MGGGGREVSLLAKTNMDGLSIIISSPQPLRTSFCLNLMGTNITKSPLNIKHRMLDFVYLTSN